MTKALLGPAPALIATEPDLDIYVEDVRTTFNINFSLKGAGIQIAFHKTKRRIDMTYQKQRFEARIATEELIEKYFDPCCDPGKMSCLPWLCLHLVLPGLRL